MADLVLYHNPKCSKSREAATALTERGVAFDIVEYLKTPLSGATLTELLKLLPPPPADLVRKDSNFKAPGLAADDYIDANAVVRILSDHPELMQRPVAVRGKRAIIGRPSGDLVLGLLDD